jgi:hypothetical protein
MIPDLPEVLVILFISTAIFGLSKLDEIGAFVWRMRRKWFERDA